MSSNSFNNTGSLQPALRGLSVVCIVLTTAFTLARLIAKKSYSSFHIEDYFSIVTWMAADGDFIVIQFQTNAGLGQHLNAANTAKGPESSKLEYISSIFYCVTLGFAKGALLFQLQRIFSPSKRGAGYIATQVLVWVNFAAYFACLVCIIAQCHPVEKLWTPEVNWGHCIGSYTILITVGAVNVATDTLILILPICAIYHLRMPLKEKTVASAMFTTGGLSFISSIARLVYSVRIVDSKDPTYDLAKIALWTVGESASIIICTCLPMMPRFIHIIKSGSDGSDFHQHQKPSPSSYDSSSLCQCNEKAGVHVPCSIHEFRVGVGACEPPMSPYQSQNHTSDLDEDPYTKTKDYHHHHHQQQQQNPQQRWSRSSNSSTLAGSSYLHYIPSDKLSAAEILACKRAPLTSHPANGTTGSVPYGTHSRSSSGHILVQQDFHVEHGVSVEDDDVGYGYGHGPPGTPKGLSRKL